MAGLNLSIECLSFILPMHACNSLSTLAGKVHSLPVVSVFGLKLKNECLSTLLPISTIESE